MKKVIIIISIFATALISSAYASTASEREYKRGESDYMHGRYDQNQHGESYKKGWDNAENRQKSHSSEAKQAGSSNNSDLAGIVAGAAAVGLIAALASHHDNHKAHESRNNHGYNSEYERGYNDAIYGGHYANNDSEGYHSGYMAGESERNNRRHANSTLVRGAPAATQNACKDRGDRYWRIPSGSTVPVSVYNYGQGNYEVTVASGHRRANCSVNAKGKIQDFLPQ